MGESVGSRELLPALGVLPGHLFWRATARVTGASGEVLPPGVDIHSWAALLALDGGATRSQQAIAEMISVSGTTVSRVAGDLVEQGLVERVRNADDRRSYALTRTAEGADAARHWHRHAEEIEQAVTPDFTPTERQHLRQLLVLLARPRLQATTPEPLLENIPFLITRIHGIMHAILLELLQPVGIEPRHFGTLVALQSTGPISQSELARLMDVSGPMIVQMIDDLEARDLVQRRRLHTDRRTQMLHLRPAAAPALSRAGVLADQMADDLLASLPETSRDQLLVLLRRLVTTT